MVLLWLLKKWNEASQKTNDWKLKPVSQTKPSEHEHLMEISRSAIPVCFVGSVIVALFAGLLFSLSPETAGWVPPVAFVTIALGLITGMAGNVIFSRLYFERKFPPKK